MDMHRKMYWDRGCKYWVGPVSQADIDQINAEPGNISVGEVRDYEPMKHTPGPWKVELLENHHNDYENWKTFTVRSTANVCLAVVGDVDRYHEEDHEGNAQLIAAAPTMETAIRSMIVNIRLGLKHDQQAFYRLAIEAGEAALEAVEGKVTP
jgi:hypothetical protein